MHTIVLATQKGGSGKSTLAIGLAPAAKQDGHTSRMIETDPQGTISNWKRRRTNAEPVVEAVNNTGEIAQRLQAYEGSSGGGWRKSSPAARSPMNSGPMIMPRPMSKPTTYSPA